MYSTVAWLIYINVDDHRCTILEITWSIPWFIPVQLHTKLKMICSLLCPEACLFTNHSSSNACIMALLKITFVFHSFLMYCICDDVWCAHYGRLGWVQCYQGHFLCYSLLPQSSWKQSIVKYYDGSDTQFHWLINWGKKFDKWIFCIFRNDWIDCKNAFHAIPHLELEWLKNKIFKQGIGIAEKSLETRRDHWDGNVNPKSLFWLSDP